MALTGCGEVWTKVTAAASTWANQTRAISSWVEAAAVCPIASPYTYDSLIYTYDDAISYDAT